MARNTNTIDYKEDYYKGFAKLYFDKILDTIIDFGDLENENGIILDYGCGVGHLKNKLSNKKVIGYDIIPELSDIDDYRTVFPNKIILSGVLEHLYQNEIESLLKEFISINPKATIVTYLPTENFLSKIAMHLAGEKHAHDDHVSKYKEINSLLDKYYNRSKIKYIFGRMAQISLYEPKQ